MTPIEVARGLKVSWPTAKGYLLKLEGEGKVCMTKKGRVNVFYLKTHKTSRFTVPSWVRPRKLEELAEELEDYFPEEILAAEIVERERRKY